MNMHVFWRSSAACTAALAVLLCTPLTGFAEESSDSTEAESTLGAEVSEDSDSAEDEYQTYTSGDYTYSVVVDAEDSSRRAARIESYQGSETEIEIPSDLEGLDVVSLGDYAFAGESSVTKFTIPAKLTELGRYTFAACTSLTEYEVAADNPYLEAKDGILYADEGATLMRYPIGQKPTDLVIEDGIEHIGHVAFADCSSLTSVKFPDSLNYIGVSAFADCIGLTEITLPETITSIQDFTFNSCTNLKTVNLPSGLTSIGAAAFSSTAIENITLPDSLMSIGEQAFINTPMMEITIPRSVSEIGYSALGWSVKPEGQLYPKDGFTIRGYINSAADSYISDEDYENRNFTFEALDSDTLESSEEESDDDATQEIVS